MYGLFCKSLRTGIVSVHMEADWDVLKARLVKLDYVNERQWDDAEVWDNLQNGYVINDGHLLWCYWSELDDNEFGAYLFTGPVVFLSECGA